MITSNVQRDIHGVAPEKHSIRKNRTPVEQRLDYWLDVALEDTFPCSDPISSMRTD